jgi:tetratricopeptide (TPR) repeat protein
MIRLLKWENGEFSLTGFTDNKIPLYAILSHTWGPDSDEVKYKDIMKKRGTEKPGYEKLRFCAEQAKRDGLLYFWIDTCCINKSNDAELSEAIRSMFRWYASATKCYVYLSDVPDPNDPISTVESAFAKSRWFTRGWTLQELIAPKSVEFFSWNGESLGHRESKVEQLHEITQIHTEALQGESMDKFSVADRKSWAKNRKTTREEDAAYCLLGIFGIHIPIMYGEGNENAMTRLDEQIQRSTRVATLTDPLWIVPFERNPRFTGRETLLAQLQDRLFAKHHTSKIAITGLGGIGKTQLVLELLYRIKDRHKGSLIMWIPVTSAESVHQGYLKIAKQLKISGCEDEKVDAKQLVQDYLNKYNLGQWLLVFDNADDMDMWIGPPKSLVGQDAERGSNQGPNRLIDYLPKNKQGSIIFTTRDRKVAVKLAQQNVVELLELDEVAAAELLKKLLARPDIFKDHQQDASALICELTYLPLAIAQTAAYINENGVTIAEYRSLLADKEEDVIDVLSEEFEDDGRYREVKNPVATTWLISFEQIRRRDGLAADYLSFMACVDPKDIPQSLLPPGSSRNKQMAAIGTLSAYSFVSRRPGDLTLDLHRLVHLATRNWLRKEGLLIKWTESAIERLGDVFPDDNYKNRAMWRMYLPHVRHVLECDLVNEEEKEARVDLIWRYARCLYRDGRWNEAEIIFSQVLEKQKRIYDKDHPWILTSMANLGQTYSKQGQQDKAENLKKQVMEIRKRVLGMEHPDTLISIGDLALTYRNQGRWKEAEDLEVQVMEMRKRVLGAEHLDTLTSMANLGQTYSKQGQQDKAENLKKQVMEIRKRVLGMEHPDTLISIGDLALTYSNQGRWKEAEDLEVQVMETRKRVLGAEHPDTLTSMANLGQTYSRQGQQDKAENLKTQVMEIRKRVLGMEHPDTLISIGDLALTYRNQGRWKEAEDLEVQVMEMRKRVLGAEHPDTLISMWNLSLTWKVAGQSTKAVQLLQKCVGLQTKILGGNHPYTLSSSAMLAAWQAETLNI